LDGDDATPPPRSTSVARRPSVDVAGRKCGTSGRIAPAQLLLGRALNGDAIDQARACLDSTMVTRLFEENPI
jgi:hypothetical protein